MTLPPDLIMMSWGRGLTAKDIPLCPFSIERETGGAEKLAPLAEAAASAAGVFQPRPDRLRTSYAHLA